MARSSTMKSASTIVRIWFCLSVTIATVLTSVILPQRRAKRGGSHNTFYFKDFPLEHHVESGHSLRLQCGVNVQKNIRYQWRHNNGPIISTSRRYQDGSDLYISNVDRKLDNGVFQCVATNSSSKYSIVSKGYKVKVYQMNPSVTVVLVKPKEFSSIHESSEVELKCSAKAYPRVTGKNIVWYHNFLRIKRKPSKESGFKIQENGNLQVKSFKRKNSGVYRCQVLHPAGDLMSNKPLAIATGDKSPYYTVETNPENYLKYFRRNEDIVVECPVKKTDKGFVRWSYRAGLDLSTTRKYFDISCTATIQTDCVMNDKLVRKPSPGRSWTGFYICRVIIQSIMSQEHVVEVRRAENPSLNATNFGLRHATEKIVPVAGKNYTIRVYIDLTTKKREQLIVAQPVPKYQWITPSGVKVTSTNGRMRMINGRDLYFENVLKSDNGLYTFTATNVDGVQKYRVMVVVAFVPTLTRDPLPDRTVLEGTHKLSVQCNVARMPEYPISRIMWKKDGKSVIAVAGRLMVNEKSGDLRLSPVTLTDTGKYQCVVKTHKQVDVESNVFTIKVIKRLRIMRTDPEPFLERGIQGKLTCLATGEFPISFQWFRADSDVLTAYRPLINRAGRYQVETEVPGKSVLVIHKIRNDDQGFYKCKATDNRRVSKNATYKVIVGEKPIIKMSTKANVSVVEGHTFRLDCTGAGDPQPKTSWIRRRTNKNPESLTLDSFIHRNPFESRRFLFSNGTLTIRSAEFSDEGIYQCIVGHRHAIASGPEIHVRVTLFNGQALDGTNGDYRRRSPLTKTILIVVGCALAYLGLIIALTVYCSLRMMRKRRKYSETVVVGPGTKADLAAVTAAESQCLMTNGDPHAKLSSGQISPSASLFYRPFDATSNASVNLDPPPPPPYPRERLFKIATLGKGEFGEVLLARAPIIDSNNEISTESEMLVSVITLQGARDRRIVEDFVGQIEMFSKLDHRSIAKLVGIFFEKDPHCFLLEYGPWGDLKQFLHAIRRGHPGQPMSSDASSAESPTIQSLSYSQRMHICAQVANGMEHISNLRYVHKDLAARNILLSPNLDVKISHLGLCNSAYSDDYFPLRLVHRSANPSFRNGRMIPLRWMPPEVIINGAYSPETDVWSYAIFVYEVLSLGETPLRKHTHSEIVMAACAHHLVPEMPPNSTPELQTLLMRCWSEQPSERPSFSEISVLVGGMVVECDV